MAIGNCPVSIRLRFDRHLINHKGVIYKEEDYPVDALIPEVFNKIILENISQQFIYIF